MTNKELIRRLQKFPLDMEVGGVYDTIEYVPVGKGFPQVLGKKLDPLGLMSEHHGKLVIVDAKC